jgi:hypothetical protein
MENIHMEKEVALVRNLQPRGTSSSQSTSKLHSGIHAVRVGFRISERTRKLDPILAGFGCRPAILGILDRIFVSLSLFFCSVRG